MSQHTEPPLSSLQTQLTPRAIQMLLSGTWRQASRDRVHNQPFEESPKENHIFVRYDAIRISQTQDAFLVEYLLFGTPMVYSVLRANVGLRAQVVLNNVSGRIELFVLAS